MPRSAPIQHPAQRHGRPEMADLALAYAVMALVALVSRVDVALRAIAEGQP